jgi:sulfur carrier protein ThiS
VAAIIVDCGTPSDRRAPIQAAQMHRVVIVAVDACGSHACAIQPFTYFSKESTMKILFINNDGGGFADYVEVAPSTTVEKFVSHKVAGRDAADYLIRVNRQPVPRDYILQEGDRITLTPTKIEGARSRTVA